MRHDVIVIGGGISGITTALYCIDAGYNVLLLEKDQRFGGRIHTVYHDKITYEAGASRIGTNHVRVKSLLKRFELTTVADQNSKLLYRDTSSNTFQNTSGLIHEAFQKVLKHAKTLSQEYLQSITFGHLCSIVLGESAAEKLMYAYGSNAEFNILNAYDGIEMCIKNSEKYYHIKEGFSELVKRIVEYLHASPQATLKLNYMVKGWNKDKANGCMCVNAIDTKTGLQHKFNGSSIVCTLPKNDLLETFQWSKSQRTLLESVSPVPLHKIYGRFPSLNGKPWFADIKRTTLTTNNILQKFIPVSQDNGLALLSYSDMQNANTWKKNVLAGEKELRNKLLSNIHIVFPQITNVQNPNWIYSCYWESGAHLWKTKVDSQATRIKLHQPYGDNVPWYLVGEAYSMHQTWVEGALETVDDIIPRLFEYLNRQRVKRSVGGGTGLKKLDTWLRKKKRIVSWADLDTLRTDFPEVKWVMLRDPSDKKLKLINVTEWMFQHPGGASPFQDNLYQNITPLFEKVVSHRDSNGNWNAVVLQKIRENTIATIS